MQIQLNELLIHLSGLPNARDASGVPALAEAECVCPPTRQVAVPCAETPTGGRPTAGEPVRPPDGFEELFESMVGAAYNINTRRHSYVRVHVNAIRP